MKEYQKEPMPGHEGKTIRDPTARYQIREWDVPGGIRDKRYSRVMQTDLTLPEATELETKMNAER